MMYLCSPTQRMEDIRVWGCWRCCIVQRMLLLVFGGAGSGGWANGHKVMVLGTIVAPSSRPSIPKQARLLLLLLVVGIPIFIASSSSTSPALQHRPSTLSFPSSPPPHIPMALHQSKIVPAPVIIVAAILLAVTIIIGFHLFRLSHG